jgi:hypothetical protein
MDVRIIHVNRPQDENDELAERARNRRAIKTILELLMALSAQVAAALEQARKLDNVFDAVNQWGADLQKQIADLKDQIVNQSPSLSEEDKAALAEITKEIQENVARAPAAILANTGSEGASGETEAPVAEAPPVQNDPAPPTPAEEVAQEPVAPAEPVQGGDQPNAEAPADPNAPQTNPNQG